MFDLSANTAALADLIFSVMSIWMAHTLYKTPRKRIHTILTWAAIYIVLICFTHSVEALMPNMSYERASMVLGFCGIFAYLYLFPQIPVSQRVFTYFMVDTSQTLLVLFPRLLATLAAQWFAVSLDVVFLCIYFPLMVVFIVVFKRWLGAYILRCLQAFRSQLASLAFFAAVGYLTLLFQVPTWEPWPALTFWTAGGILGMIAFVSTGYALAFRTLRSVLARETAESSAHWLSTQMAIAEQHYKNLLERIEQSRIRNHDLRHHVNTLSGLCVDSNWEEVCLYVKNMDKDLRIVPHKAYCGNGALDSLLGHYESLCAEKNILFNCKVRLPDLANVQPLHLCVIFGNGLQNALEASEKLSENAERKISIRAVMA